MDSIDSLHPGSLSKAFTNPAFQAQTAVDVEIPALGHIGGGEPDYVWASDNRSVTAFIPCLRNPEHRVNAETVGVTAEIIPPTDTKAGSAVFTSERFTTRGYIVQTKTVETIPALKNMTVLRLPSALKVIESEAFSNLACQAVIIPDGCTAIEEYAFRNCANLKYVWIPAGLNSWPETAFEGCSPDLVICCAGN